LPPNSMLVRLMVFAHCSSSSAPRVSIR
jgi:hypothetical protein